MHAVKNNLNKFGEMRNFTGEGGGQKTTYEIWLVKKLYTTIPGKEFWRSQWLDYVYDAVFLSLNKPLDGYNSPPWEPQVGYKTTGLHQILITL